MNVIRYTRMGDDQLTVEVHDGSAPGEKVMVLDGVLNMQTVLRFRDCMRQYEPETLVLDMTRVRYVDSSGLGAIIGAYVTLERKYKRLLLAGLNDRIWSLFRTCKVDELFTRYSTVADAERIASV